MTDRVDRHSLVDDGAANKDLDPAQLLHTRWEPNLPEDGYLPPERFRTQAAARELGRILHTAPGEPVRQDRPGQVRPARRIRRRRT
ncbi:hypothetical protein MLP_45610 [Microlunatus phosphovorus NM-1]|uniref:Uncharacterized protein n=1 Tax=Microlunatus phosphovorus (strain ATCC 700054 / DSM 10555 / JCM 9379 / NBRC 101784 / NCIMB 13414 / VKM Ac-1990 / NM-1) TaxID=1032480 RepID=F5XE27_MICPN|nr:hypothetical protein [Microlunatus phosphovorus]BAK37575.1 hypothetical protein MLP_45610 [Microlunatus phosphovorus NM-1]